MALIVQRARRAMGREEDRVRSPHDVGAASRRSLEAIRVLKEEVMQFETLAIHAGQPPDPAYGAVGLFIPAESLGGVDSLIEHPWSMTHLSMSEDARAGSGITDDLIRISVGIEHIADLLQASEKE